MPKETYRWRSKPEERLDEVRKGRADRCGSERILTWLMELQGSLLKLFKQPGTVPARGNIFLENERSFHEWTVLFRNTAGR